MSLVISKVFTYDEDAGNYIQAVEAADGQALEAATRQAINNFVVGCKQDGIWSAIKASCILAGARTRQGALVPLRNEYDFVNNLQPAPPQSFNFVDADYNRKTGFVGNGSTKYLNSNRNNNADPQDSKHLSVFKSSNATVAGGLIGTEVTANGTSLIFEGFATGSDTYRINVSPSITFPLGSYPDTGFIGAVRSSSSQSTRRYSGVAVTDSSTSQAAASENILVFRAATQNTNARLAFYSIGESLDLARLDSRVTDLINAFGAAIP